MCERVWSIYEARRSDGSLVKLRIQDLPENRLDDAVELFAKYFINETLLKAAGVPRNEKAVAEYRLLLSESMKDSASHNIICCEAKEAGKVGQILGVSSMVLVTVGSNIFKNIKLETKEMQMYMKLDDACNFHEQMKKLHINKFYDDIGFVVHPQYRKLGVAMEFAKARRLVCMAHNVAATGAMITSIGTEIIAKKDNWVTASEINLKELGQQHGVNFEEYAVSKVVFWKNPQFKQDDISK